MYLTPVLVHTHGIKHINIYKERDIISKETLLITRKGTVGNSIFINENKKYSASSEIFIIKLDKDIVNGVYFSIVNNSYLIKKQYQEKNTGTIMPSISQEKLKSIKIPIPPIKVQNEIVNHISKLKQQIKELQEQAKENREMAIQEFENEIFLIEN